jgi:uncharacterized protein
MQNPIPHIIRNNIFWVSPERCLFWEEQNTLIIADLHLGKTGHFRKEGIPVPPSIYKADLQRLMAQIYFFKAERLIIVGDFSHSKGNKDMDLFLKWRRDFSELRIDLVRGNHDILETPWYQDAKINMYEKELAIDNFLFVHENTEEAALEAGYNYEFVFSGHLHPGIQLKGQGKQSITLPCFFFTPYHCVLPAFSKFTGTYLVKPQKNETVYALTGTELIKLG